MNKYGKYIRKIREEHNDTLEDLAKKLDMSFSTLGKYERGERKITPELLEQVAEIYDAPMSYFFGEQLELPKELKEVGIEWISLIDELKDRELTPERIKKILDIVGELDKLQ
jgi:transcriptional regulator with XRE-family HTH domain